uniref:EF-hand domain-containing protein n=1 Tax=Cyclophora tenuis TaxID=216820 RepID=A0A7S1CXE3_CYCTE|mmetsp:Transcript_13450/g.22904  ORF Transcript_13450/g.22904 Transcript_13450/m.22904 type:complete len:247 (+) Transcript_13450:57-797(+)
MAAEGQDVEVGGDPGGPDAPGSKPPLRPVAETTFMERIAGFIAGAAVATALAAIVIERSAIVSIAGVLSMILGPYLYYQQTRLTDIAALKETHAAVEAEVNRLHQENERLGTSIDNLTNTVDKLEDVENALDTITQTQGKNVATFADQVEQNKKILAQMKQNLKGTVMQNLLSVIMASDADQDNIVDPEEIDTLLRRIKGIGGIEVHEDRFRQTFSGGNVSSLMSVVSNLLRTDVPEEEQIFVLVD